MKTKQFFLAYSPFHHLRSASIMDMCPHSREWRFSRRIMVEEGKTDLE